MTLEEKQDYINKWRTKAYNRGNVYLPTCELLFLNGLINLQTKEMLTSLIEKFSKSTGDYSLYVNLIYKIISRHTI